MTTTNNENKRAFYDERDNSKWFLVEDADGVIVARGHWHDFDVDPKWDYERKEDFGGYRIDPKFPSGFSILNKTDKEIIRDKLGSIDCWEATTSFCVGFLTVRYDAIASNASYVNVIADVVGASFKKAAEADQFVWANTPDQIKAMLLEKGIKEEHMKDFVDKYFELFPLLKDWTVAYTDKFKTTQFKDTQTWAEGK